MRRWLGIGGVLALVWLFVRGVTPGTVVGEVLIGLAVGLPIAYAFRRFYEPEFSPGTALAGLPWVGVYLAVFLWELVTANLDVAYRVLSPSMPIEPDVVELPLRVQSDAAIATIANSITLTPGTLTMDYDEQRNSLYVHAIATTDRDAVLEPIRTWEGYALHIFDEKRSPSDPVPDPDVQANSGESETQQIPMSESRSGGETDGE